MLKRRIIPIQLLLRGRLVKTVGFGEWRDVGDPVASSRVYNSQYADELIFLNIDRNSTGIEPLITVLEAVSEVCFMPLSVGGGIRCFEDAATLIRQGADKVVLNSICYREAGIIARVAERFGSQAVTVGIDVRREGGDYRLFSECGREPQDITLDKHIRRCVDLGAGEILIQSIDRDGTMDGYDLDLLRRVGGDTDVPVIAAGGAGDYSHLKDAFLQGGMAAVACGSLFNFSDSNPIRAKAFLSNYGLLFKEV